MPLGNCPVINAKNTVWCSIVFIVIFISSIVGLYSFFNTYSVGYVIEVVILSSVTLDSSIVFLLVGKKYCLNKDCF
ncbi:MAG: hypothetical protein FWH37_03825 [Candidatus Bathyarchaeota archaeon]|nr:hypothetical protein [Candidatus Termiticorpusculum sp.]